MENTLRATLVYQTSPKWVFTFNTCAVTLVHQATTREKYSNRAIVAIEQTFGQTAKLKLNADQDLRGRVPGLTCASIYAAITPLFVIYVIYYTWSMRLEQENELLWLCCIASMNKRKRGGYHRSPDRDIDIGASRKMYSSRNVDMCGLRHRKLNQADSQTQCISVMHRANHTPRVGSCKSYAGTQSLALLVESLSGGGGRTPVGRIGREKRGQHSVPDTNLDKSGLLVTVMSPYMSHKPAIHLTGVGTPYLQADGFIATVTLIRKFRFRAVSRNGGPYSARVIRE